jgi:hypothetical protein
VHYQARSITASKFARSWPPCASRNSVKHGLQVYFKVVRLRPPSSHDHPLQSASPNSHHYGLQVHLQTHSITASKCISELNVISASKCISECVGLSDQMHLQTRWITACKCISDLHDLGLHSHLQTRSITASKLAQSWPPSASTNSLDRDLGVHL